ncbi:MAG: hypothetical protein ABSC11_02575 [Smithella sp.]
MAAYKGIKVSVITRRGRLASKASRQSHVLRDCRGSRGSSRKDNRSLSLTFLPKACSGVQKPGRPRFAKALARLEKRAF